MMKKSLLIQGGLAFTMFLATMLPLGAHAEMSEQAQPAQPSPAGNG